MQRLRTDDIAMALRESDYAVRTLANQYVFYIPSTRIGDERFYPPEAVEVFRLIFEQLAVGVREEYIELMLGKRYPVAEVTVVGLGGGSAFQAGRRDGMGPGQEAWPAGLALPGAPGRGQPEVGTEPAHQPRPARDRAAVMTETGAVTQDALLAQARALQQRVEELEERMRRIDAVAPGPATEAPASQEGIQSTAEPGPAPVRRGFDDLASRDSLTGD
jgi:hypothetical protein